MIGVILRVLVNVLGLWLATALVSGITATTDGALIWAAISLGLVNAFVRPLVVFLTLPVTLLTLGLFLLFINAAMLNLAAWFVDGFDVVGVIDALFGAVIVGLISWVGSAFIGGNGRYGSLTVERRR
jgi:putative membrane protein